LQLPDFALLRPATLAECLQLLDEHQGRAALLAGGTDLLVNLRQRLVTPATLITIRQLEALRSLHFEADGTVRIGAGCSLALLAAHSELRRRLPGLTLAIRSIGSWHVRHMATLGGNLALPTRCWYTNQSEAWRTARPACFKTSGELCHVIPSGTGCHALNSSDSAPALVALNARISIARRGGEREVALADFYRDDGLAPTALAPGEIVTGIAVPATTARSTFIKVAQRTGLDYGLGTLAAAVTGSNRRVTAARIVAGSIGSWPMVLGKSAEIIVSGGLTDEAIEAAAEAAREDLGEVTNLFSPSAYKRRIVRALVRRALRELRAGRPAAAAGREAAA
jgi:4-hydroxybenzoyl-CoA reductase subunit beta